MIKHLTEALDKSQSDYCDIRWERRQLTKINCAHRDVNFIGSSILGGGNIRSLHNGGFASAVLTDPANIEDFMEWTNRSARAAANKQQTPVRFAPASSHQDQVRIAPSIDPRSMPLAEKKALVDHYNDIILSTPGVQTSRISYHENAIRKYFVSSEGAKIDQENLIVMLSCVIVAKGSEGVQTVSIGFGGGTDYQRLLNRDVELRAKIAVAVDLLKAPPVKAGSYTAVLNGEMTGVFAHEAFGHFSEADIVLRNRELKDQMCLGRKMGHPMLNISDDAALKECPGSFCYDDDGVPAQKTALIKEGVLVGRLHSRETAALFGESLSGNSRAADHSYTPAMRMSNIFIEPGQDTPEALIGAVKKGIYLLGCQRRADRRRPVFVRGSIRLLDRERQDRPTGTRHQCLR